MGSCFSEKASVDFNDGEKPPKKHVNLQGPSSSNNSSAQTTTYPVSRRTTGSQWVNGPRKKASQNITQPHYPTNLSPYVDSHESQPIATNTQQHNQKHPYQQNQNRANHCHPQQNRPSNVPRNINVKNTKLKRGYERVSDDSPQIVNNTHTTFPKHRPPQNINYKKQNNHIKTYNQYNNPQKQFNHSNKHRKHNHNNVNNNNNNNHRRVPTSSPPKPKVFAGFVLPASIYNPSSSPNWSDNKANKPLWNNNNTSNEWNDVNNNNNNEWNSNNNNNKWSNKNNEYNNNNNKWSNNKNNEWNNNNNNNNEWSKESKPKAVMSYPPKPKPGGDVPMRPPTRQQRQQRRQQKVAVKQTKQPNYPVKPSGGDVIVRPPTRQQKQQHRQQKVNKKIHKKSAAEMVWDVNENDVDSDDTMEMRKKSVLHDVAQRKSYVNYERGHTRKKDSWDEKRRKSVFDDSSSSDCSSSEEDGRRLTVDISHAKNRSVSGFVNLNPM